ncbi:MAG TPA: methyltransferase domain-containing protein [Phycisphaerae bacterium]|nr:methyltransferase domain-containing protein [Phycisphaerae bacterium]HRY69910.1 methyltransferase domain-containing protein [Phycisphaerae bacterium]HSA27118.1 methyltransferase domain-containing protein [Phycisphaerae bacterium]
MLDLIQHFKERAASYDQAEWVHDPGVMAVTLDFLGLAAGQRILDVGAGTGAVLAAALAACPSLGPCVAVDLSREMLAQIRDSRILTCGGDAEALPILDGFFDAVACRQSLHYVEDLDQCLREIRRVLAATGILLVGQMTPFGEADEEWWKVIVKTRQPLRRRCLTLHELLVALMRTDFVVVRIVQIRATESLNAWLERYQRSASQVEEVRRLHLEAPAAYKELHRFRHVEGDTLVDNCWTFVRAGKSLPQPKAAVYLAGGAADGAR